MPPYSDYPQCAQLLLQRAQRLHGMQALRLLRPGGIVAFDNALWHDRVADPAQRDSETVAIRELGKTVREHDSLLPVLLPVAAGSLLGAWAISKVSDSLFERAFGVVMLLLLVPLLREVALPRRERTAPPSKLGPRWAVAFFLIGIYGGSFQAGVGIPLLFALSYAGFDLVRANAIKVIVTAVLTATAVPVFLLAGQIAWAPAAVVAVGYSAGAVLGARLAVRGGERLIRPALAVAVIALAGRMLGLY